jgi:hypothetical protein
MSSFDVQGFCTTGGNVVVFAVGAVYDRAIFAGDRAKCVIDRAYSGKWVANSYVVQSHVRAKSLFENSAGPRMLLP